jgi:hypothetical protein
VHVRFTEMLWTLSASLLVMTLTLIQFLKKVVDKVKAIYFVYPSDAVVDQVLPQVQDYEHKESN